VLDQLHADMAEVLHDPDFVKSFVQPQGFTAPRLTREQFAERVRSDYALWGQMVEKAGITKKP
jgi:tripartite-type tricarboxylate transporter receptor subunit TctC